MKLKATVLFALAIILASCSIVDQESDQSGLTGQWEWIRSSGGFGGEVITPDSPGEAARQLFIQSDNTFTYLRADTVVRTGKYSLRLKKDEVFISYQTQNDAFSIDQKVKLFGNGDTLVLTDECFDCYTNMYVRKKQVHSKLTLIPKKGFKDYKSPRFRGLRFPFVI